MMQVDQLLYNISLNQSSRPNTELQTFISLGGACGFRLVILEKVMTLPQETISLEGVLLQAKKQIEGSPESTLSVAKNPIIFRPLRVLGVSRSTDPSAADFVFRQVNFTSSELSDLFVLQNQDSDVNIFFEDCHFSNQSYSEKRD